MAYRADINRRRQWPLPTQDIAQLPKAQTHHLLIRQKVLLVYRVATEGISPHQQHNRY